MNAIIPSRPWTAFRACLFPLLAAAIVWRLPAAFDEGRFWAEEGLSRLALVVPQMSLQSWSQRKPA